MSLNLIQTVSEYNGNTDEIQQLIEKLHANPLPPVELESSPHISTRYAAHRPEDIQITSIAYAILLSQLCFTNVHHPDYCKHSIELFGYNPLESIENQKHLYLFSHAAAFMTSAIGKCAARASYASMVLAKALPEGSRIQLRSSSRQDHFVIQLSIKPREWFVFDPLTNPETLFPLTMYQEEILSKFPDVQQNFVPLDLKITKELSTEFFNKWPTVKEKIISQFLTPLPTINTLFQNIPFKLAIKIENPRDTPNSIKPKINLALERIQSSILGR